MYWLLTIIFIQNKTAKVLISSLDKWNLSIKINSASSKTDMHYQLSPTHQLTIFKNYEPQKNWTHSFHISSTPNINIHMSIQYRLLDQGWRLEVLYLFNLLLHNRTNFCSEVFLKFRVTHFKIVNKLLRQWLHVVFIYQKINKLKGSLTNWSIWILTSNKASISC